MKNQQNETNNPSEKKNDIYSLLIKYLEMIDSKIYKTAALPRFLSIFSDFKKYLSDSFDSFYEYIDLTLENKVNDAFILSTLERELEKMVDDDVIPDEKVMCGLVNIIGEEYNSVNSKFIASVMMTNFTKDKYITLFNITNLKFGSIIFSKKLIFTNYYTMLNDTLDSIKTNEKEEITNQIILDFYKKYNKSFNLHLNLAIGNIESLIKNTTNLEQIVPQKITNKEVIKKINIKKEEVNDNVKIETKKNKNEITKGCNAAAMALEINIQKDFEKKIDLIYEELNNKINNITIENEKLRENYDKITEKYDKITIENEKLRDNYDKITIENEKLRENYDKITEKFDKIISKEANNTQKIKILEEKLSSIQIRVLLKGIVNYNLALLKLRRKGKYIDRINVIIECLKNYEGSEVYIKFFKKISESINSGNENAHNIKINYIIGLPNIKIIDSIFSTNIKKGLKGIEIKKIKEILNRINIEETLQILNTQFVDKATIYDNIPKIDLRKIIKDSQNIA